MADVQYYVGHGGNDSNNGTTFALRKLNYSALTTAPGAGNRAIINIEATHSGNGLTSIGSVSATKNSLTMTTSSGLGLQANDIIVYGMWWGRVATYSGTTLTMVTGFVFPFATGSYTMYYIRPVVDTRSAAQLTFSANLQSSYPYKTEIRFGCVSGDATSAANTGTTALYHATVNNPMTTSNIFCDVIGRAFLDYNIGRGIICKPSCNISNIFCATITWNTTGASKNIFTGCTINAINSLIDYAYGISDATLKSCLVSCGTSTIFGLFSSATNNNTVVFIPIPNVIANDCILVYNSYILWSSIPCMYRFKNNTFVQITGIALPRTRHKGTIIFEDNNNLSAKLSDEGQSYQGGETRYTSAVTFAPDTTDFIGIGTMAKLPASDSNFTLLNSGACSQVFFNIAQCYFNGRTVGALTTQGTLLNQPVKTYFDSGTYLIRVKYNNQITGLTGYNFWAQLVCDNECLLAESGTGALTVRSGNGDWNSYIESSLTLATAQNVEMRIFGSWYDAANRLAFGYAQYSPDNGTTWIDFHQTYIDGKIAFSMAQKTTTADKILSPVTVTNDGKLLEGTLVIPEIPPQRYRPRSVLSPSGKRSRIG